MAESWSTTATKVDKQVIVTVKRKASQPCLDAFWLEIKETPLKRAALDFENLTFPESLTNNSGKGLEINDKSLKDPLLDFENLSISESSESKVEVSKPQQILMQYLQTVSSSEETYNVLRSFVPSSSDALRDIQKSAEGKLAKPVSDLSRNTRFEQVWKNRLVLEDESVYEAFRLYDVVRVDDEERGSEVEDNNDMDMGDYLLDDGSVKDVSPNAAVEIESDVFKQASLDGYVYDLYTVVKPSSQTEAESAESAMSFPLVQVDDDDDFFCYGRDDSTSDYEVENSDAKDYFINYPDDDDDDDDAIYMDEVTGRASDEESEHISKILKEESESSEDELVQDLGGRREEYDMYQEPWIKCPDDVKLCRRRR